MWKLSGRLLQRKKMTSCPELQQSSSIICDECQMRSEGEVTFSSGLMGNKWRDGRCEVTHLKLDDPFLGKAQVHAFCVLQVEGTLVELGDGVVGVQQRRLLVHLTDDLGKKEERD